MESFLPELTETLTRFGPPALAVMAFLETAFLTGFFVPAGVALLFMSFLASEGVVALPVVVSWAAAGAIVGDTAGFWLGRRLRGGESFEREGWFRRVLATIDPRRLAVLRRTPLYSVTLARLIPFVRTIMPMSAGRSQLTYVRFLYYELIGVALWALSYVSAGYLAGESWRLMSRWIGGFWTAVFALVLIVGSLGGRQARRRARRSAGAEQSTAEQSMTGAVDESTYRDAVGGEADGDAGTTKPPRATSSGDRMGEGRVESRTLVIGLTGNVASGKSTVARVWSDLGVPVLSADALAREVVEPGTDGLRAVAKEFGDGVLTADGALDRASLRERVFRDDAARRTLEAILHPLIAARRRAWIEARQAEGADMVAYEIPLLFETGQEASFDVIVFVDAPVETRLRRITETRGIEAAEAKRMVESQAHPEAKRAASDLVIENAGSLVELEALAREILGRIRSQHGLFGTESA